MSEVSINEINKFLEIFLGKTKEEAIAKAVEALGNDDRIMLFSDLEKYEIPRLSVYYIISDRYGISWLKTYCDNELKLRVSNSRLGRKEIVSIASSKTTPEKPKSFLKKKEEQMVEEK
ncbi:MAG: hypothetical protein NZ942_02740 [Candidatus Aenigmarchaeota archaeon]|nr:hypothetical protein [Candidatus Aenigmarchaeota archaeon]